MNINSFVRKFTLPKLEALNLILQIDNPAFTTTTLSGTLEQKGQQLGGTISALARTKIEGQPLIVPVGKHLTEGFIWRLNEDAAPKGELKIAVDKVLEEQRHYGIALA